MLLLKLFDFVVSQGTVTSNSCVKNSNCLKHAHTKYLALNFSTVHSFLKGERGRERKERGREGRSEGGRERENRVSSDVGFSHKE